MPFRVFNDGSVRPPSILDRAPGVIPTSHASLALEQFCLERSSLMHLPMAIAMRCRTTRRSTT